MAGLKTRKKQRFIVLSVAIIVLFGAVFLIMKALGGDSLSLFMQPTAAVEKNFPAGKRFRLGGLVEVGSVSKKADELTHVFVITDCVTAVPVEFKDILPDLFREGQGVVTEGAFNESRVFVADTVLAKHDENYMPPESAPKDPEACEHPDGAYDEGAAY